MQTTYYCKQKSTFFKLKIPNYFHCHLAFLLMQLVSTRQNLMWMCEHGGIQPDTQESADNIFSA